MKRFLSTLLCLMLLLTPVLSLAEEEKLLDPNDPHTFQLYVDWTWMDYDTFEGGICQDFLREKTGITIDMIKATDSESLNLMISSGELPDLIACSSSSKIAKLSDSELCYPLQELIDKYVPQWQIPDVEKKINAYFAEDGQYYMLKNEFNTAEEIKNAKNLGTNFGQFHIRNDIYTALGSPKVQTKEDFFALMAAVKEKYPDMQPLVFNPREYNAFGSLVGYDTVRPMDENGNLVMSISDPNYRAMLLSMNELHRAGYIDKENFSYNSDDQTFQKFYAGNVFMVTHYAGNDEQTFTAKVRAAVPDAEVVQLPLLEKWKYSIPVSGWAAMFISKKCSDPERAIKMLYWAKQTDNSISLTYGYKGTDWDYDADGNIVMLERYNKSNENGSIATDYKDMAFSLSANNYITIYKGYYAAATPATRVIQDEVIKRATITNAIDLAYPKANTDLRIAYDDINSLSSEYFSKLCMAENEESFDAIYEEMLAEAEKIGLSDVNSYLTKTYKDVCALLGSE